MSKVRFGVVGIQGMGGGHVNSIVEHGKRSLELTAVADLSEEAVQEAVKKYGCEGFANPQELFDSGLCDAVIIATPHYWHPVLTIQAARAGLHVLCEKPLAATVGPARTMIEECKKNKVAFGTMFQKRTGGIMQKTKNIIDSGRLGEIFRVEMTCSSWFRTQQYYEGGAWRGTWDGEGGGVLINQAPHHLDLFQWFTGMPEKVLAMVHTRDHDIEVEDTANVLLDYGNGKVGYIYATTAEFPGYEEFRFSGEKGTLIMRDNKLMIGKTKKTVSDAIHKTKTAWPDQKDMEVKWSEVSYPDKGASHLKVIQNFAKHIDKGTELIAPGDEAINSLELSNAAYISGYKDKSVELPVDSREMERLMTQLVKEHSTGRGGGMRKTADKELKKLTRKK